MPMPGPEIERLIKQALPDAIVELTALANDNDHWSATVTSEAFRGLPRVRQHQLVNAAFGPVAEFLDAAEVEPTPNWIQELLHQPAFVFVARGVGGEQSRAGRVDH